MDRTKANLIFHELRSAVREVADKHGLTIVPGKRSSFSDTDINFSIKLTSKTADAIQDDIQDDNNHKLALFMELNRVDPEYRKSVLIDNVNRDAFRLTGVNEKARKNVWIITRIRDSKQFVTSTKALLAMSRQSSNGEKSSTTKAKSAGRSEKVAW